MNQEDLRVIRSKKMIREAFLDLVEEKGYKNITIKDIAEKAMINRKTFYNHYENIDALYSDILKIALGFLFDGLEDAKNPSGWKPGSLEDIYGYIRFFLHNISQNKRIIKVLADDVSSYEIIKLLFEQIQISFKALIMKSNDKKAFIIPVELLSTSISAQVMIIIRWYIDNSDDYSEEEAAKIFMELITNELVPKH